MAREWNTFCIDCGGPFRYSSSTYRAAKLRGESLPGICPTCAKEYVRENRSLGRTDSLPDLRAADQILAELEGIPEAVSCAQDVPSGLDNERQEFGVSDGRLLEFYQKLDDPLTQVILVEAPTGAGKSTFFPFRLLMPPPGVPNPEVFTRNGQIVVTQPRIQATKNIPAYVGKLHGCGIGAGYDIGFRHSKEHAADWRCKLVYLTDGTLINWISAGLLGNISLVMLDEAHERSLTIDLIIGLLTKMLPRYPWLKLVIASATIDCDKFLRFFAKHLRGGTRCAHIKFEGKPNKPIRKHFRCGYAEWHDAHGQAHVLEPDKPADVLPYNHENLKELLTTLSKDVGDKCIELLERMHPTDESQKRGVPGDLVERRGDILAFLHGKKPIEEALTHIEKHVQNSPVLKECVELLPLYTTLPADAQKKALQPPREGITRVIISTNVAETSLTIKSIKHVVETGLINRNIWDTPSESGSVRQYLHSQAGCKQRWGRAGRVTEGDAWCLYTKQQFETFPQDTRPAILCSRLEPVVLTAKVSGVDALDEDSFPWLDAPPPEELQRALRRLQQHGALDEQGDITPHGLEIQRFGGDPRSANLLLLADRFACAVEMATILPLIEAGGKTSLLTVERDWDESTKRQVDRIHAALTWGCRDDLELSLKVYAAWREASAGGRTITGSWAWPEIWKQRRKPLPAEARAQLGAASTELENRVVEIVELCGFDNLLVQVPVNASAVRTWLTHQRDLFALAASETWAKLWSVNDAFLRELEKGRDERIDMLAVRKKEKERRPINFEALDRLRMLLVWANPDLCFFHADDTRNDLPCYERLADRLEPSRGQEMPTGGSSVEGDEGDEDEWIKPAILVQISDKSICQRKTLDALVGFSVQLRKSKPHPNAEPREFVNLGFVVAVDRASAEQVCGLNLMEFASFVAERFPPTPIVGPNLVDEGPVRRRLFLDQRFPVFSQFRYRPLRQRDDRRWDVELLEAVNYWPASRAVGLAATEKRAGEGEEEAEVESTELCTDILVPLLNEDGQPRLDSAGVDPSEDVEDSDHTPDSGEEVDGEPALASTFELPPPVSELDVPRQRPFRAVLVLTQDTAPTVSIAELVTYDQDHGEPILVLETPTPELCYDLFQQRFQVGDRVEVTVVGQRRAAGSSAASLRVREPTTGMETDVFARDLAFHDVPNLIEQFSPEQQLELCVDSLDPRLRLVRLSALPLLEEQYARIQEAFGRYFPGVGRIALLGQERVRFLIERSPADPDNRLPANLCLTAELFWQEGKGRIALQCELGRECNLRLRFSNKGSTTFRELPESLPALRDELARLWGPQYNWDEDRNRLSFFNSFKDPETNRTEFYPFTDALRREALSLVTEPICRNAIEQIYRQANGLQAEPADLELESRYPPGMLVRGVLTEPGEAAVANLRDKDGKLRLDSGLEAFVRAEDFRTAEGRTVGSLLRATVLAARTDRQQVFVTLQTGAAASQAVRRESLRALAHQFGLINQFNDTNNLRNITGRAREELPQRLMVCQRDVRWLAWARLRVDARHTGLIIGTGQVARRDIEAENDVVLGADGGEIYLLAPTNDSLQDAIEGVRRRMGRDRNVDEQNVAQSTAQFSGEDMYAAQRCEPVSQIAAIPAIDPKAGTAWKDGIRSRFAKLLGLLKK